jgi:formylglycine-generating enzyme required for sulfatase activity
VTEITVVTAGSGYTDPPDVVISAPFVDPPVLDLQMIPLLTIVGTPGDTNEIQFSPTLGSGSVWIPLTNVVLTAPVMEWYDRMSPPGTRGFYRAVLLGMGDRPTPGPRFVWLPAGQFLMGSPDSEQDRRTDEGPQTLVTLTRGFWVCRYEVTQGEYLAVVGSNPSRWQGDTNHPVEQVTWSEATNYCALLTEQQRATGRLPVGWEYRLPTEAQWEYACRAGTTNRFYWGDDPNYTQVGDYAICRNIANWTQPVGRRRPNRWGLYDMAGNVGEWCRTGYGTYPGGSVTDPQGSTGYRVRRGGGWANWAYECRSASRDGWYPNFSDSWIGFRVVLVPVP